MLIVEIFYSTFWISMISVIWFYTDFVLQYAQLLGIALETRMEYASFVIDNPYSYFPDYLREKSLDSDDRSVRFLGKVISCPFCLLVWLAVISSLVCSDFIITAPVYVLSLFIVLQIKKML